MLFSGIHYLAIGWTTKKMKMMMLKNQNHFRYSIRSPPKYFQTTDSTFYLVLYSQPFHSQSPGFVHHLEFANGPYSPYRNVACHQLVGIHYGMKQRCRFFLVWHDQIVNKPDLSDRFDYPFDLDPFELDPFDFDPVHFDPFDYQAFPVKTPFLL
jgi:hypothetical protein